MTIRFSALALLAVLAAPLAVAQDVLYEQPNDATFTFEGAAGITGIRDTEGWIYSENFTVAANDGSDGYLADDFVVPTGREWTVDQVAVIAFYLNGTDDPITKATSFNVIIWNDDADAGTPGTEAFRVDNVTPSTDGTAGEATTGIIEFTLASPPVLQEGTYWLTVQANMPTENINQGTRYFWGSNRAEIGEPVQWWNVGGALATAAPCDQGWGDNTPECGSENRNDNDPTVYLRIRGNSVVISSETAAEGRTVSLLPTRPNPATARTLVPFSLREAADVRLAVYDVLGREVALVTERAYGVGDHAESFDASALAPGTYVARLTAGSDVVVRTLSVAR